MIAEGSFGLTNVIIMKILHILNKFQNRGNGISNVCCDLVCEQAKAGHDVVVVSSGGNLSQIVEANGGRHIQLDQSRTIRNIPSIFFQFRKIISAEKPDIIHSHAITGAVVAAVNKILGMRYKTISTMHNVYQRSSFLMLLSDRVVALSPLVRSEILKMKFASEHKIIVIENGVIGSPRRKPLSQLDPIELEKYSIVTAGAVSHRKGADTLLAAAEILARNDVHFYWIGNRDWPEFETMLANSPVRNNFHMVGFDANPLRFFSKADVFVLPSRRETFPLALLEAKEAGLPIICTNVDGVPDAVGNGEDALLIPPSSPEDLAAAIHRILDDKDFRVRLGQRSLETRAKFTVAHMNEKYMREYIALLRD